MKYNIDPELLVFVEHMPDVSITNTDLKTYRAMVEDNAYPLPDDDINQLDINDFEVPGKEGEHTIPVRVYAPKNKLTKGPALLQIHGGGFFSGSINFEHGISVALASNLNATVGSVEYRLAPEHPYPCGLEDCYEALRWLHKQATELDIDPARIGIFGQSGGGGIAAALALYARDKGGPAICFQYLEVPELDDRLETPSSQFEDTPMLTRDILINSWQFYLGDKYQPGAQDVPYYAAPARATDLSGLPPTYLCTMEFDPLRDEGIAYAAKLLQDGVQVELHHYPGTFHASSMIEQAAITKKARKDMFSALSRALNPSN